MVKIKNMTDLNNKRVRVRFAPSPSGQMHIGGIRTALYNYLFAKKHGGDFILRIEDTDETRFVPGAEEYIIESLKWCGIKPNEGQGFGGGSFGPYSQSERKHLYKEYADRLIESGHAYYAFDTPEELDKFRVVSRTFAYNAYYREKLHNSLTLPAEDVKALMDAGVPYVIRFKMPRNVEVIINDIVRGNITFNTNSLDDKVLFKSSGQATYHLANVVDDHLMEITHVIRGEEWLTSAPLHHLLYQAFGWDRPEFCHLPLILDQNGKKLNKRALIDLGFPGGALSWLDPATDELLGGYREKGFLPEAFINMLALIGWNPGGNVEVMNMDELIAAFSLEKVNKSGGKFDPKKAEWFSAHYVKNANNDRLAEMFRSDLAENGKIEISYLKGIRVIDPKSGTYFSMDYVALVCGLLKEKVPYLSKFWENGSYFFVPLTDSVVLDDMMTDKVVTFLASISKKFETLDCFDLDNTKECFNDAIKDSGIEPRDAGKALRAAVCGNKVGPPIFDIMVLLGKPTVVNRIDSHFAIY